MSTSPTRLVSSGPVSRAYGIFAGLLLAGLSLGGCAGDPDTRPEDKQAAQTKPSTAREVVVIRALTPGDRGCYVELEPAEGPRREDVAAFELCERPELVGQRVHLTRERTGIQAASCSGDPECAQTDTVDLIVSAEPVR